ncbi:hypothetical protein [Umezawaea beigongshangensis]|nr:hypothetical protein [Umezawaea beigongshangensis]
MSRSSRYRGGTTSAIALTVGDVARAAGVAPSAVRFYVSEVRVTA